MRITTRSALSLLAGLALFAAGAVGQTYAGVGGRHEQQIGAIQRNSTLASNGTASVPSTGSGRRIFVRFLADTGRNVTGFDVKMRYRWLGEVVRAWLYTADAANRPANVVASGEIGIGTDPRFCRASFRLSYRTTGGSLYFLAFELPAAEDLVFSTASGGPATSVTWFVTANGAAQQAGIQYKVDADGFSPAITMAQPYVGQWCDVSCSGAAVGQPAVLLCSMDAAIRPLDLHGIGAPGSFLYLTSPSELAYVPGNPGRTRATRFSVPNDPAVFLGLPINLQWLLLTNSNALGAVTSNVGLSVVR